MTMSSIRLLLAAVLLCASIASAQISNATLFGTVTDASGGVVSGAAVTAKNIGTGVRRSATTDANGEYAISNLPAAHYSVTVTMAGFKTFNNPDVELQVAQRALVNAALEVGAVGQELTVTAAAPMLDTSASSVGQVVNPTDVDHMPLNGRSFWQLTDLTPGATYQPGGQTTRTGGSSIRSSVVNVIVNGAAATATGWSLDGANITEMQTGGTLIQPNIDALQEFKVESANMPAEYGHTPAVINTTTKSGSNAFHGTLFEFVRNSVFDARNFFYVPPPGATFTNEPLRRNQFGGTAGGPIVHNKTFFFADLERTSLRQGVDFNNVVPSNAMRGGDFSELLKGSKPQAILDPLTRQPYPGNIIPASQISPQAKFFLPFMPTSNVVTGTTSRAALTNNLAQDEYRGDIRLDHQISAKTQMMGRYSINDNSENDPNPFPALGQFALHSRAQNATIGLTHVFSPRWVDDARISYYRSIFLFGPTLPGTNFNHAAGVQGFDDTTSIYSFPQITLSGYQGYNGSPSDQRPKSNRIRNFQYADNASYSSGRHSVKAGVEEMHQTAGFYNGSRSVGIFNFVNTYTTNAFGDFLTGYPDSVTRDYFKQLNGDWANFWSLYAQDSFRVTPTVTLNIGLRFELNSFYQGIRGQKSAFNLATGQLIIPSSIDAAVQPLTSYMLPLFSDRLQYTKQLGLPDSIQPPGKDFGPRVGIAWRPLGSNKWVVRTAFGIFYTYPDSNTINNTVATVPFVASQTVSNDRPPAAPTRNWANFFLGQGLVAPNPNPGKACAFGFVANSCSTPDVDSGAVHFHSMTVDQWNFSIQRQITASTSLDVAYVGEKTSHVNQNLSMNDPLPGPGAIQPRRPYPQWGVITYPVFEENANYNSLQAKFEARAWHGLTMLGSYTFSKCIDSGSAEGGTTISMLHVYRAVCDYDLPQTLHGSFDYQLPFGKGKHFLGSAHGLLNQIAGGWEFAGIVTLRSGSPFTPTVNGDVQNTGVTGQRPDVLGAPILPHDPNCWFYTSANSACTALEPNTADTFALPPAQKRYGTGGRNILRADGLKQVDFTLMKTFVVTEAKQFEFRSEFFNILNHPTFAAPTATINTSSGGLVGSTLNAARIIQLALKFRF